MRIIASVGIILAVLLAGCGDVEWFPEQTTTATAEVVTAAQSPTSTAKCCDGTFSQSQNCSGTCSHHGGVEAWLLPGMGCNPPTACGSK
jgi:PBP1b-binding outer membrane lipoprotein LpoB